MSNWYRVRYDDQGSDLTPARHHLDRVAQAGTLEVLWLARRSNPAILIRAAREQEAWLIEGLLNTLPRARLGPESGEAVTARWQEFPQRYGLIGTLPVQPWLPWLFAGQESDIAVRLSWRQGQLQMPQIAGPDKATLTAALATVEARVYLLPLSQLPLVRRAFRPSQCFTLPPVIDAPTLASRNVHERAFAEFHAGELILGTTPDGQAVGVQRPLGLAWIGAASAHRMLAGLAQSWNGRIVVLDGMGGWPRDWQDVSRAEVFVAWNTPGKSTHVNPLTRLPNDTSESYLVRVMEWLALLNVTPAILGVRAVTLIRALIRLILAHLTPELNPLTMLQLLDQPTTLETVKPDFTPLPGDEAAVWQGRDWSRDRAWLTPAATALRGFFDAAPEMALWYPPYLPATTLQQAPWSLWRIPTQGAGARSYWAGMWPLFRALYNRSDTLTFALGLGHGGREALALTRQGASVLAWGETAATAVGHFEERHLDWIIGAGAEPTRFGALLDVSPQLIAAQADDQALARLNGDVGSIRLQLPQKQTPTKRGWATVNGLTIPPLVSILGDEPSARLAALALAERQAHLGQRLLILGTQSLWPELQNRLPQALFLTAAELPMLNPLAPRPRHAHAWVWWGAGLGIPAAILQAAYRDGARTLQDLLSYVEGTEAATALKEALQSGFFSDGEADPRTWFEHAPVLAVESPNPALTRTLAMAGLEAGARLICWQAPGLTAGDEAALNQAQSLVYPDTLWIPDVLVTTTHNGLAASLPERLQPAVKTLLAGEGYLFRRGRDQFYRVILEETR